MIAATPWPERTFTFDLQPGAFPALLQRLRGTPARARDLVAGVPEERLAQRPDGRRWSAKENIGHLADLFALDDARLGEYLAGAAALSAADPANAATEGAGHNGTPVQDILERLAAGRMEWIHRLEALSEADLVRSAVHPRLQRPLRLIDWAWFVAEHDDHHLARADEAIRAAAGRQPDVPPAPAPGDHRALFEIPEGVTYLNCASMSPQLRSVTAVAREAVRAKATPWTLTTAEWFSGPEELRALAAQVMGVEADAVALVPAVSYGIAIAARNAVVRAGQSIVLLDREFPSNVYAWRSLARRTGARVVMAARQRGESWTEAIERAVDDTTAVVSVPQCHWTDGSRVDLERVGGRARAVGAMLVVDASQSLGACPLDVRQVQPDFLVAVGYKWLLGPYGLGYLYAAPRWRESGAPLEESWMSRAGSENFARLVDYRDDFRPGARRFDMGEYSQFVLAPMAAAALRQILAWGVGSIQQSIAALTGRAADLATAAGFVVEPPERRVGHMIGIRRPSGIPRELPAALAAAGIYVSLRGDSIRIAPHLYNAESDIDRLFEVLRGALPEGGGGR